MSTGAIVAANLKRQREEKEHCKYTTDQISQKLEFKILRSVTGQFRDPKVMARAVDEEFQGGWVLLEKFDSHRIRFYRPRGWVNSGRTEIDPYRTEFGISSALFVAMVFGASLMCALLIIAMLIVLK